MFVYSPNEATETYHLALFVMRLKKELQIQTKKTI